MSRHKNSKLEIRIQAVKRPKRMDGRTYLRHLLASMETGRLPRGLDVQLYWRNPETRNGRSGEWQSDEFTHAVADSSEGFSTLLRRMINRRLYR